MTDEIHDDATPEESSTPGPDDEPEAQNDEPDTDTAPGSESDDEEVTDASVDDLVAALGDDGDDGIDPGDLDTIDYIMGARGHVPASCRCCKVKCW